MWRIPAGRPPVNLIMSAVLFAGLAILLLAPSSAAAAAERNDELYEDDPLGLITAFNVTTHYSLGEDLWDVWICELPEGTLAISPEETVELLRAEVVPYFSWISKGRYRPSFRVGGVVEAVSYDYGRGCSEPVSEASENIESAERPEGAIVIVNKFISNSTGSIGFIDNVSSVKLKAGLDGVTTYPRNGRELSLSGASVAKPGSLPNIVLRTPLPVLSTVAHEMGHAIGFPHSYRFSPYDHPMDVMGDSDAVPGLQVGTVAINRYAAGWMDPSEVEIYESGRSRYTLGPLGAGGTQMLVLRSDQSGFIALGARVKKGFDAGIPKEGVESYFVDQQSCGIFFYKACLPSSRLTQAVVAATGAVPIDLEDTVSHVMEVGDGYTWQGITVTVVERIGDAFVVEVDDQPSSNRFADDDNKERHTSERKEELYTDDPLGLIAGFNVTTHYSLDEDLWDVWICEVPEGTLDISLEETIDLLQAEMVPYFKWLSRGRYRPSFRAGGVIEAAAFDNWGGCTGPVNEASQRINPKDRAEGAILIVNKVTTASFGGIGAIGFSSPVQVRLSFDTTYPDNRRDLYIGGQAVAEPGSLPPGVFSDSPLPVLSTVAHEMGHAIGFPHSYRFSPYDHPMDVMGDSDAVPGLQVGTVAINRYAAGWMDPSEVEIYESGRSRYTLGPLGAGGTQMLVLRSDQSGFIALGARVKKGFDAGIPKEGVESYFVDQQPPRCFYYPDYEACFGTERPTQAVVAAAGTVPIDLEDTVSHVMEVGDGYTWQGITVTVVERIGDDFVVEVTDGSAEEEHTGRFADDDGNIHEKNIEIIADLGITVGCGGNSYCPSQPVTRAQMAAFLMRALDETIDDAAVTSRFSDVSPGVWYLGYVERLADLGIVRVEEETAFRPDDALTRLEMAVWMARGFDFIDEVTPRGAFADVPADQWYAGAVEGLLAADVTRGCSADPPAYCPHDPVRRDQMASFIARALANRPQS